MSTIIVELYDALREAGISDEKARAAAAAVIGAESEAGFATKGDIAVLRADFDRLRADVMAALADMRTDMADMRTEIIRWTVGTIIAVTVILTGIFSAIVKLL